MSQVLEVEDDEEDEPDIIVETWEQKAEQLVSFSSQFLISTLSPVFSKLMWKRFEVSRHRQRVSP